MKDSITNFVLLRHGEAQMGVDKHRAEMAKPRPLRCSNVRNDKSPLTETGKRQTITVAKALKKKFGKFDVVFVSPYLRTRQTAALIKRYIPCSKIIVDKRIRERSKGKLELLTRYGVRVRFPGEYKRMLKDGTYRYRPPGGENFSDVKNRIDNFMRDARLNRNVLVITHGADIACIMDYLEYFSIAKLLQVNFDVRLSSVTCYSRGKKGGLKRRFYNKIYY